MSKIIEGQLIGKGKRFAIVVSRFNDFITEKLLGGAVDALVRTGTAAEDVAPSRKSAVLHRTG